MPDKDATSMSLSSCIALLEQHKKIHGLSLPVTVVAVAILLAPLALSTSPSLLWLGITTTIILLGLAEIWFALRIGFDQQLLASISADPSDLQRLDQALIQLKLMPSSKAGRGLEERLQGCLRLLTWQGRVVVGQLLVAVIGVGSGGVIG